MDNPNSIFEKMTDAATEKVSEKGFERATQKEVTLAGFGMLSRQIKSRMDGIAKPLKWVAGVITTGMLWYIVSGLIGL